ncbi:hypothetical protein [Nocardia flavorosea]|uniref:hypothetical protein n=1 Tax=Nocardia flavorosea TaxID=53429 RepID=UPI0024562C8E|nr:hypothetical protein [Nocardia flavorosea]
MDISQPPRYDLGFPCRNVACREARHPYPACPHELLHQVIDPPLPPGVTPPSALRAALHISKLEKEGRLEHVRAPDMRWIWLVPPIVVLLFLLMLF